MKKIAVTLFILSLILPSLAVAATVGGPEIDVPEESLFLKEEAVKRTLDRYEYNMRIKASLEIEVITKRELTSSSEVTDAELKGQYWMLKISNNFYDIVEPYIKVGTSNLEIKWDQNNNNVKVEPNNGFIWGIGAKAKLLESKDYGIKLTLDAQYRNFNADIDIAKLGGSTSVASPIDETFDIKEWQISLLTSKKIIVPIGRSDYYIIPYGGITFLSSEVDVKFTQSTSGLLYSTYDASDENMVGLVLGCNIMPFFLSYYLLNFELRLINETAFTLGGTIKF